MRAQNFRTALPWLCVLGATGCSNQLDEPAIGTYRATLQLPGGEVPFGLEVAQEPTGYVLYLSNGGERTRVSNVRLENQELHAVFPGERSSLRAQMRRKKLEGTVTLIEAGGKQQSIAFAASLGDTYRFYEKPLTDNADVSGRWQITFTNDAGATSAALAVFEQQHDRVTGRMLMPTGPHQNLEGQVHGEELQLSMFTGGPAHLYKLKVNDAGDLEGEYWQGFETHATVVATRTEASTLNGTDLLNSTQEP